MQKNKIDSLHCIKERVLQVFFLYPGIVCPENNFTGN